MATKNYQRFLQGIGITPKATTENAVLGDLEVLTSTNKLNFFNGTINDPVVTEAAVATLTHKSMDGNNNTFTNLPAGSLPADVVYLNATQTLTNKTLTGNTAANLISGAGTFTLNTTGTITVPNGTDTLVTLTGTQTLTGKTIAAGSNTISGLANANLSGAAAISNANLATMIANTVKANNTAGVATPTDIALVSTNTNNSVVLRDSSGNFAAGTITANLTGTATTVTTNANLTGPITSVGNATSITNSSIDLTTKVTGILPIANGGTAVNAVTTVPAATAWAGWDTNKNFSSNNFLEGYTTTATAGGTTTLTVSSTYQQYFTGTLSQTCVLPVASTLVNGASFFIGNSSSGNVTIQTSGGSVLQTISVNTQCIVTCVNSGGGTGAASWSSSLTSSAGGGLSTWAASTGYAAGTVVVNGKFAYVATGSFTSGATFAADILAGNWVQLNFPIVSRNYNLTGMGFEDNTVGGWTATGIASLTNGLPTSVGTASAAFSSSNGGRAKGASTTAPATANPGGISGTYALNLATSGAGTIGDGYVSQPIAIDGKAQAKVLQFSFSYKVVTGTPVMAGTSSNTYAVAVYDPANNAWLPSSGNFNFVQLSGVGTCSGTFQTATNTTAVQLFVYSPVAPTAASSLYLDDFYVGPQILVQGVPMTDWVAYTPVLVSFGTATGISCFSRRNGGNLEATGVFTAGTVTATQSQIAVGFNGVSGNVTIDTSLIPPGSVIGKMAAATASTTYFGLAPLSPSANQTYFNVGDQSSTTNELNPFAAGLFTGVKYSFFISVPIVGWSSNTTMSNDTDTRIVAAAFYASANGTSSTTQTINFDTKWYDTHAAVTAAAAGTGTWKFTAPVTGYYNVGGIIDAAASQTAVIYKNGVAFAEVCGTYTTGSGTSPLNFDIQLNSGDFIDLRFNTSGTYNGGVLTTGQAACKICIKRISGPAVIAASESVNCAVTGTTTAMTGSMATLINPTKVFDTHSAYNTSNGVYTIPISGKYRASGVLATGATVGLLALTLQAVQSGSASVTRLLGAMPSKDSTSTQKVCSGSTLFTCLAGDTIVFQGSEGNSNAAAAISHFEIDRIGN